MIKNCIILFAIIMLISTLEYSFADLQSDTDTFLEKGIIFFEGGNNEMALKYFNALLEIDENNVDALYYKSKILTEFEQKQDATSILEKILGMDIVHVGALEIKADELLQEGKFSEALLIYEDILEADPKHAKAHSALGDSFLQNGDTSSALKHYEISLQIDPVGKDITGVFFADKILMIEPNHVDALVSKGSSLVKLDRTAEGFTVIFAEELDNAISYFDKALEFDPENTEALFNKGRSLIQISLQQSDGHLTDEYKIGLQLVKDVLRINPDHVGALMYISDRLISDKNYEEALLHLDRAIEIEPNNTDVMFLKAVLSTELGNYQTSATYYDKILQINPHHKLSSDNFIFLTKHFMGYTPIEGNLDVTLIDSNGFLASHFQVPTLSIINHNLGQELLDEWEVIGTENRDGLEYEVLQYENNLNIERKFIYGGAAHYGISYPFEKDIWKLYANYWTYLVDKGDTVTFTYTVFRPL